MKSVQSADQSSSPSAKSADRDPRTYAIIGAAMEVHRELGCGFNEVFFQDALEIEFQIRGIPFVREQAWHVFYKGRRLPSSLRPDFVCYGEVIVELKALTEITGWEEAQILGYLKGTGFQTGLLLNFGTPSLFQQRFTHASKWLPEASSADDTD
uniref:GxxExxY protein n=1 Tax=Prosthecobacter sp. TaxID=1965333 RepID=UPI0037844058